MSAPSAEAEAPAKPQPGTDKGLLRVYTWQSHQQVKEQIAERKKRWWQPRGASQVAGADAARLPG